MADITNSHSLTDFQRNSRTFIEGLNQTKTPLLLTVNGKVQAVLVDPVTYQAMEKQYEQERLVTAILEGEKDVQEGRVQSAAEGFAALRLKHGF